MKRINKYKFIIKGKRTTLLRRRNITKSTTHLQVLQMKKGSNSPITTSHIFPGIQAINHIKSGISHQNIQIRAREIIEGIPKDTRRKATRRKATRTTTTTTETTASIQEVTWTIINTKRGGKGKFKITNDIMIWERGIRTIIIKRIEGKSTITRVADLIENPTLT